ncbi:serine hydrolase, partial [Chitinophagales bacterium]|nr:serine hydrolase [Chitinophagales bacterium]
KNELGYKGLIFTDALNMKGVSKYFAPGDVDLRALLAGNDVLLFPEDVAKAVLKIKGAIDDGLFSVNELNERVRKILKAKFRVGLENYVPIKIEDIDKELNDPSYQVHIRKLIENAITVAKDDSEIIPFLSLNQHQFASLSIGTSSKTDFQSGLDRYAKIDDYQMPKESAADDWEAMETKLSSYSTVVIGIHDMSRYSSKNFGITTQTKKLIERLQDKTRVVLVLFGSPYALKYFDTSKTVVVAYQDTKDTQDLCSQLLFGAFTAKGKLPVSASPTFKAGMGFSSAEETIRLRYGLPEEQGINSIDLSEIDLIAEEAISTKATPGCQVLVAKKGMIIYDKSFGYHTYSKSQAVKNSDLYDVASITKVAGTLMALLDMYENENIGLRSKLGDFLPMTKGSNKENIRIGDMLTHEAGLKDWIPFYTETVTSKTKRDSVYSRIVCDGFTCKVADDMYIVDDYSLVMWQTILDSELENRGKYKYSDLGYYFLKAIVEHHYQEPIDEFAVKRFLAPMGLNRTAYKPLESFSAGEIVPTEDDHNFRMQLLQGHVHDMGAAMLGGVGGHAGLFSNANDLAKIMQMYMNGGSYGGNVFFEPATIELFSQKQGRYGRRGFGFDKPELRAGKISPTCEEAPASVFGHTGFTGTCAWADPDNEMIYIFLSNRIHPDAHNWKLVKNDIRTRIQSVIYQAMRKSEGS